MYCNERYQRGGQFEFGRFRHINCDARIGVDERMHNTGKTHQQHEQDDCRCFRWKFLRRANIVVVAKSRLEGIILYYIILCTLTWIEEDGHEEGAIDEGQIEQKKYDRDDGRTRMQKYRLLAPSVAEADHENDHNQTTTYDAHQHVVRPVDDLW